MSELGIVGAGVSGLALARDAEAVGAAVTVLESSDRIGGAIRSERKNGFLLEYGANSVLCSETFFDYVEDIGLGDEVLHPGPEAKRRYIAQEDSSRRLSLVAAPSGPLGIFASPLLSTAGKLRLLAEPFFGRTPAADESVYDFFTRRMGRELAENLIAPALRGVWAADIHTLSCRSALPKVWGAELGYRSVLLGLIAEACSRPRRDPSVPRGSITFRNGMETLPRRIADTLRTTKISVSTNASIEKLSEFERIILTSGAPHCAAVVRADFPELSLAIEKVPSASVGLLHLAFKKENVKHPLDGFGFLVPPRYGRALLGALFSSSVYAGRAPEGYHLLTCFVGEDPANDAVKERVFAELDEALRTEDVPEVLAATFLPRAIPSFPVGHFELQAAVDRFHDEQDRIRIVSSWLRGISVPQRLEEVRK